MAPAPIFAGVRKGAEPPSWFSALGYGGPHKLYSYSGTEYSNWT